MDSCAPILLGSFVCLAAAVCLVLWWRAHRPQSSDSGDTALNVIHEILAVTAETYIVCGAVGARALSASPQAAAWGVVQSNSLRLPQVRELVERVAAEGRGREVTIHVRGSRESSEPRVLFFRAAVVASQWVLVLVEDHSQVKRNDIIQQDFLANISHELKTPVGAISLLAEALEVSGDDQVAVQRFTRRLRLEADRLTELITDTIDLSRIQGASFDQQSPIVALSEAVREALDRTACEAERRRIAVAARAPENVYVRGSKDLLVTALKNLIDNALRYSPEGTAVGVGVKEDGEWVKISVTDQGEGMAPQEVKRIFERFYRVDSARSRHTGGSGLGLSIVKHIVTRHGGRVQVWSQPGAGSTFTVHLPLARVPGGKVREYRHEEGPQKDTHCRGRGIVFGLTFLHFGKGGVSGGGDSRW